MAYEKDGIQYPSVTGITGLLDKPALIGWAARTACDYVREHWQEANDPTDNHALDDVLEKAAKAHTQKAGDAADAGKLAHRAIELHIKGEDGCQYIADNGDSEEAYNAYDAFLKWELANDVEYVASECQVFCCYHGYAGRFDCVARVNGTLYLIDFKTSSGVYDEMRYQLCAYRQAYNEGLLESSEAVDHIAILHLNKKDGMHAWHDMTQDMNRYTDLFNSLTRVYYLMKNRRLKNNPFALGAKNYDNPIDVDVKEAPF